MIRLISLLALFAAVLAACEYPDKPAEHPIVGMAVFDLNCPRGQLRYFPINDDTVGVEGCGQRTKYVRICSHWGVGLMTGTDCRWVRN